MEDLDHNPYRFPTPAEPAPTPAPASDAPLDPPEPGLTSAYDGRLLFDGHTHTPRCQHARGDGDDYAQAALSAGLRGFAITCHNPMPGDYGARMRMKPGEFDAYVDDMKAVRDRYAGRVDVLLGLEADFVPGLENAVACQVNAHDFDVVIGSVHPQIPEYRARYFAGDTFAYQKVYFEHLGDSAESGLFDVIAHGDLIKQMMPRSWSLSRILPDICHALDRIAGSGVAMELNTSGWRKRLRECMPGPRILYEMAQRRIPVTLGADAHQPERVGENFDQALALLDAAGYRHVSYFRNRERFEIPMAAARASLETAAAVA